MVKIWYGRLQPHCKCKFMLNFYDCKPAAGRLFLYPVWSKEKLGPRNFKIQGTYFKIRALYFLQARIQENQGHSTGRNRGLIFQYKLTPIKTS